MVTNHALFEILGGELRWTKEGIKSRDTLLQILRKEQKRSHFITSFRWHDGVLYLLIEYANGPMYVKLEYGYHVRYIFDSVQTAIKQNKMNLRRGVT
jgi:hypothetical protein